MTPAPDSRAVHNTPGTPHLTIDPDSASKSVIKHTPRSIKTERKVKPEKQVQTSKSKSEPKTIIKSSIMKTAKTPKSKKCLKFNLKTSPTFLPMKKRKITVNLTESPTPETDTKIPWVGTLTSSDKHDILNNKCLTSDIINFAQNIISKQFKDVHGFQDICKAPCYNKNEARWNSSVKFDQMSKNSVQIHHTGNSHWVTSIQTSSGVFVLDSLYDTLTSSMEVQLSQIYGTNKKRLLVKLPEVQKQSNSVDCGLFALAFAVEFCLSGFNGGTHVTFNQRYMREHLVSCLEKGEFRNFPHSLLEHKGKIKSKSIVIESNCECGQADTVENMVGCEWSRGVKKCNVWKHMSCAGLNGLKDDELLNWYCQKHQCE